MSSEPANRLHALDAVRAIALLLGVVLHASMSFIPGPPVWIVQDNAAATEFSLLFYVPHMFRMVLFFLIAGYFARFVLERRSLARFALDRGQRILLPLVTLWLPIFIAIASVFLWGVAKANGGELPDQEAPPLTVGTFPLTHLWFLYLLTGFYLVSLPLTALMRMFDRKDRTGSLIDAATRVLATTPLGAIALALPAFAWFASTPFWMQWFGIPTPDTGLVPNSGALIAYGTAFAAGWAVRRNSDRVLSAWKRSWHINLAAAVALTVMCLSITGIEPLLMPAQPGTDRLIYSAAYALGIWTWTFGLTGLALHVFSRASRTWRYLADASYWVYLMHLPLVMALQIALSDVTLPGVLKLTLIVVFSMVLLLASYQIGVRHTWLGLWLNGRRPRPDERSSGLPVADKASA